MRLSLLPLYLLGLTSLVSASAFAVEPERRPVQFWGAERICEQYLMQREKVQQIEDRHMQLTGHHDRSFESDLEDPYDDVREDDPDRPIMSVGEYRSELKDVLYEKGFELEELEALESRVERETGEPAEEVCMQEDKDEQADQADENKRKNKRNRRRR